MGTTNEPQEEVKVRTGNSSFDNITQTILFLLSHPKLQKLGDQPREDEYTCYNTLKTTYTWMTKPSLKHTILPS